MMNAEKIINKVIAHRYKLLEKMNSTFLADLYKAIDLQNGFPVAIKIFYEETKKFPSSSQLRFKRDMEAVSKINHINILKTHSFGEYKEKYYIVMEYFPSKPLSDYLTQTTHLTSIDKAIQIILQLSSGLSLCHEKGLIHRIINPGNILVSSHVSEEDLFHPTSENTHHRLDIKLANFGYHSLLDLTQIKEPDRVKTIFGYLAPEMSGIMKRPIDARADIYSLGILLYKLMTGRLPYESEGQDISSLIHKHIAKRPIPPSKMNAAIPKIMDQIVLRLMAKDPQDRYQCLANLIADLERYGKQKLSYKKKIRHDIQFVGREKELRQLKTYIEQTKQSKGNICLIYGEAGVGKSRMVKESLRYVQNIHGIFAEGKCNQYEFQTPYKLFHEVIKDYIKKLKRRSKEEQDIVIKSMKNSLGELGGEVVKIAPEITKLIGEPGHLVDLEMEKQKTRFMITVTHFIVSLSSREIPVILFFDDLQWTDEGSIELLGKIAAKIDSYPLLIIAGFRDTEIEGAHPLRHTLELLKKEGITPSEIHPTNLAAGNTRKMIAHLLSESEDTVCLLSDDVYQKAQGNPFFLIETIYSLADKGIISYENNHFHYDESQAQEVVSPESVVEVILKRIKKLSRENWEILSYAAVLGRQFHLDVLQGALHLSSLAALKAVQEGIEKQFIMGNIARKKIFYFLHDRIREAFYSRLPEEERIFVHQRIGEYFEKKQIDSGPFLYTLAYHFTQANITSKALKYSLKAGNQAKATYAHNQAIELYETCRKLLRTQKGSNTQFLIEILQNLGECYRLAGRFTESLEALQNCQKLVPATDTYHQAQLLNNIANTLWERGKTEKARKSLENALKILNITIPQGQAGIIIGLIKEFSLQMLHTWFPKILVRKNYVQDNQNTLISQIYIRLGYIYYFTHIPKMFYFYLKGLNFTEKYIGPSSELAHLYIIGSAVYATTRFPWLSRSFRDGKKGIKIARDIGNKIQEGRGYGYLSLTFYISNKIGMSLEYAQKSISLLKRLGEFWELGLAYLYRDFNNCLTGRSFKKNIEDNQELIKNMQETGGMQSMGWALFSKGKIFSLMGKVEDRIIEDLKKSAQLLEDSKDCLILGYALAVLAFAHSRRKEHDKAIEFIKKAKKYYTLYHTGCFLLDMFPMGAEVYLHKVIDTPTLSKREKEEYLKNSAWFCQKAMYWGKRFPYTLGWAYQVNGTYHWLKGKKKKGITCWEKGMAFLRLCTKDKYRLGHLLLQEAVCLLQKDPRDRKAYEYLLEARDFFIQTDAEKDLEKTNSRLKKMGLQGEALESCKSFTLKRYLESLLSISEAIGSIFHLEELLNRIMDYALQATGAERGALLLYEGKDNELKPKIVRGMEKFCEQNADYTMNLEMVRYVEKTQKIALASLDISAPQLEAPTEKNAFTFELQKKGIREALCIPLQAKKKCLGVIYLDNSLTGGVFDREVINLMKSFALQASFAIENAYLVQDLIDQERFRQKLIEQAPDMIVIHDMDGKIINVNQQACDNLGYDRRELLHLTVADLGISCDHEETSLFSGALENGPITSLCILRRKDGSRCPAEVRLSMIESHGQNLIFALTRDISERRKMEEELQKIQRLESLGILAGGIAHDFNNLLTAILGNISLIELYTKSGEDILTLVEEIKKASNQAKHLTQQLLTFSRGGEPIKKKIAITKVIQESTSLALSGSRTKCKLSLAEDLWSIEADEGQINQVINNLIINANQAMAEGGVIQMQADNVFLDSSDNLVSKGVLKKGEYIKISFKDQGLGIPEEHLLKIFDPYFTTKQKGSGLGLSISYSVIKKHNGHITVDSTMGIGTTFTIYLPASDKESFEVTHIEEDWKSQGKGSILIMDDQIHIRKMIKNMLTHLGYEVICAEDGAEAIELYRRQKELNRAFKAVILDLTVPGGIGGREAIQQLRKIDPEVKAIVSSGYSNDPIMSEYDHFGFQGVVTKPFDMKELSEVLNKILNKKIRKSN